MGIEPTSEAWAHAAEIAFAVGVQAQKEGVAPKISEDELRRRVHERQWAPAYRNFSK
jgi:malate dehydrogenase (oxaloacetate-decarboxylating)